MKLKMLSTCLAICLASVICANSSDGENPSGDTGLSANQFRNLADSLPPLPGTIQAVQFLRRDGFWINRAAVLTQGKDSGWQIFLFHVESHNNFVLEWRSGKLGDSFAVSSADQLQAYDVGASEQALKFSGCAAHSCPDVFSVMLYVPSKNAAFTATYTLGKITYFPASDGPEFQFYKKSLDHLIAEHRSIAN